MTVTITPDYLRLEGHDLGDGVAAVYGPDIREYEWVVDVAIADVPALCATLGIAEGEGILDGLERAGAMAVDQAVRAGPHKVVWSRLGD